MFVGLLSSRSNHGPALPHGRKGTLRIDVGVIWLVEAVLDWLPGWWGARMGSAVLVQGTWRCPVGSTAAPAVSWAIDDRLSSESPRCGQHSRQCLAMRVVDGVEDTSTTRPPRSQRPSTGELKITADPSQLKNAFMKGQFTSSLNVALLPHRPGPYPAGLWCDRPRLPIPLANDQDRQSAQMKNLVSRASHHEALQIADSAGTDDDHRGARLLCLLQDLAGHKAG